MTIIFSLIAIIAAIHIFSALTLDRIIVYSKIEYVSPKITPELDNFVAAFVSDTHAIKKARLEKVVEQINRSGADLLLLGGDFPDGLATWWNMEVLSQTQAKDGIYGVEGNHDDFTNLFAAMRAYGITPLANEGLEIRPGLFLAGLEDYWRGSPNVPKAIANAKPGDFVLLAAHNPDLAMTQDTTGVDVMLCGHSHGGLITFFGLWAPYLSLPGITYYGQKFRQGWVKAPHSTMVYVSRGTGPIKIAPRVFSRPEVVFLTLKAAPQAGVKP